MFLIKNFAKHIKSPQPYFLKRFSTSKEIERLSSPYCNVTDKIKSLTDKKLYQNVDHPLGILKYKIQHFFSDPNIFKSELQKSYPTKYAIRDQLSPVVSTKKNFDDLLVPVDHPSRKKSDTYYISESTVLRTHTSAHQKELIESNLDSFIVFGDVYRRDEIDSTHYPVFHQMEAVRIFKNENFKNHQEDIVINEVLEDLKSTLEQLVKFLFGDIQMRWVPAYFPFTDPSLELEIYFKDQWLEMLGCGVIHRDLMKNCGRNQGEYGWAAGLGLERFSMLLFDIPDVRLFWSEDKRFLEQFKAGNLNKFIPFSKYPVCYKDVSFWLKEGEVLEENELFEHIRNVAGDLVEKVECIDVFIDKKNKRSSKCYRIHYRSLERTLSNHEIDELQLKIRDLMKTELGLSLR